MSPPRAKKFGAMLRRLATRIAGVGGAPSGHGHVRLIAQLIADARPGRPQEGGAETRAAPSGFK